MDLYYISANELIAALVDKRISAVELLEATIARIEKVDEKINAIVARDFARARQEAKAADAAIAKKKQLPLLGLPITVKESFDVTGLSTSWGNTLYKNWQPEEDALAVARLKAAGAIVIGKTNVPYMLRDWQTYNDIYGTTNNPYDYNYTPGGSSGGSAAALAAGLISLELGSDLAGSLRAPAHFCGIATHKPSLNVIPTRGASPPAMLRTPSKADLAVVGPMARRVDDLILAFNVMAGPDELEDGKGYALNLAPSRHNKLSDFRVLFIDDHPLCPTSNVITQAINNLVENLGQLGAKVSRMKHSLLDLAAVTQNYSTIYSAFTAELPQKEYEVMQAIAVKIPADDQSIRALILRAKVLSHREWLIKSRERQRLREQWRNLFKHFDVILCPVMPTCAFPHDHSDPATREIDIDGAVVPYINQLAWPSIATIFDSPATVVPIAYTDKGLPMGVQIIGNYLEDYTTLQFAKLIEQEFGNFLPPALRNEVKA